MLGNWSFGDYFKKEAIKLAWDLLTEVYKINPDILYVTIFEGDKKDGLNKDNDSYKFWKEIVSEDKIILGLIQKEEEKINNVPRTGLELDASAGLFRRMVEQQVRQEQSPV